MNINDFKILLERLYNGETLTSEELSLLDSEAYKLAEQMENNALDYNSQNILDCYVSYFNDKNISSLAVNNYNRVITEKRIKEVEKENKNQQANVMALKPIKDNSGVIKAITVIEVVVVLGIFVAILALVLL
jgi:hypothetical protein